MAYYRLISYSLIIFITISLVSGVMADSGSYTLQEGIDAYNTGNYEKALLIFDQADNKSSDRNETIYRIRSLSGLGRWNESLAAFNNLSASLSPDPDLLLMQADILSHTGNLSEAEELVLRTGANSPEYYRVLAGIQFRSGKETASLQSVEKGLNVSQDEPRLLLMKGKILIGMNKPREAEVALVKALQSIPNDPDLLYNLGGVAILNGRYSTVIPRHEEMARSNPDNPYVWESLAYLYDRAGEYDKALEALNQEKRIQPDDQNLKNSYAYTLYLKGSYEEALTEVDGVLRNDSENEAAMDTKGAILLSLGRYNDALSWLTRAVQAMPADPEVNTHIADLYMNLSRYKEAQDHYQKAVHEDPNYGPAWFGYAKALMNLSRYREAADIIEQAYSFYPGNEELIDMEKKADDLLLQRYIAEEMEKTINSTS